MEPHQHDAGRVSLLTPCRAAPVAAEAAARQERSLKRPDRCDQPGISGGASWYTIRGTSWRPINMMPVGSVY